MTTMSTLSPYLAYAFLSVSAFRDRTILMKHSAL